MNLFRQRAKSLNQFIFVSNTDVFLNQSDIRADVFDTNPEELLRVLGIRRIEWAKPRRVSRSEDSHRMHDHVVGAQCEERRSAEGSMGNKHIEFGAELASERDDSPRHDSVATIRMNEDVDSCLVFGGLDGPLLVLNSRTRVLPHLHFCTPLRFRSVLT